MSVGKRPEVPSEAAGVCLRTNRKWRDRFEQEGPALHDRSLRSKLLRKPIARGIERIKSVRRHRMPGKDRPTFGVLPRGQRM